MNRERRHLDALTGIRFVAALMVLAFHAWPGGAPGGPVPFYRYGNIGVSLFFVLSGFILGYNYLSRADSIRPRSFYWARFARIYPVYLLGAVVAIVWTAHEQGAATALGSFLFTVPLTQAWFSKYALVGNGVGWSLSVEALFYALFPWLARSIARLDPKGAALGLAATLAIVYGPYAVCRLVPAIGFGAYDGFVSKHLTLPLLHLPEFVAGILIARMYGTQRTRLSPVAADGLALASFAAIWCFGMSPWQVPGSLFACGGLVPPFGLLIYALCQERGAIAALLGSRPLVLLGESSYALYIMHMDVLHLTPHTLGAWKPALVTVVSILVSIAVFLKVEQPARTVLLRWAHMRRGELAVSPS